MSEQKRLEDGLEEGDGHEAAADEFEEGAEKETDETAPPCTKGGSDFLTAEQFAYDGTDQRTDDDTGSAEEQTDEHAYRTTPHTVFGAAELLGAPCRNDVVQYGNHNGHDTPDEQHLPREIDAVSGLRDPQAGIGDRCPRQTRNDASDDANDKE